MSVCEHDSIEPVYVPTILLTGIELPVIAGGMVHVTGYETRMLDGEKSDIVVVRVALSVENFARAAKMAIGAAAKFSIKRLRAV